MIIKNDIGIKRW